MFLSKLFCEKRLVKTVKVLSLSRKSINPIQKYPHITQSYACILKIFAKIIDFSVNILISSGICSTQKLSKWVTLLFNVYKATQWVPILEYSSRFITYVPSFNLSGRLFLE